MWEVTEEDFETIRNWGLELNPFKAAEEFSPLKSEQRWENPEQVEIYKNYVQRRQEYIKQADFDDYYRKARKPIDRRRWEFLMLRKAWFIMPLGWKNIAVDGECVADIGCGDGDTVQRLINFVDGEWKKNNISNRKLHIVGIDLNESRVENAKSLVKSSNPNITFEFTTGDLVGEKLTYKDKFFDYTLCCGVLEILNDEQFSKFMDEFTRVTRKGLYIEDLFEKFPGGFPRDTLGKELYERGFKTEHRHVVLSEPFSKVKMQDPKKLWPMLLDQNIWAARYI